jgi:hypothetical protein
MPGTAVVSRETHGVYSTAQCCEQIDVVVSDDLLYAAPTFWGVCVYECCVHFCQVTCLEGLPRNVFERWDDVSWRLRKALTRVLQGTARQRASSEQQQQQQP